ncbi:MAG: insulinase family protein [Myxococcales bacterium]|nr:insulinase family protein [Myxococcales bacterium]
MNYTLDNGLRVILAPTQAAPVVAIQAWVGVGSADESEEEAGLAHFHEHMLFKGTARRQVGQIAQDVEGAGGYINAWTSFDETVYHLTVPSDYYKEGLDILADVLQHSSFDADEMKKESEVILEEIKRSQDMPTQQLSQKVFALTFSEHTYKRPIIGYEENVKGFGREDMLRFYRKWYVPNNIVLVLAGDFELEEAKSLVHSMFGEMQGNATSKPRPTEPAQTSTRFALMQEDTQESYLQLGFHGPSLKDQDLYAIEMLAVILGQGESSRLDRELLRKQQLVNGTWAYAYSPKDAGLFLSGASLSPGKEREALDAIIEQIVRLQQAPPTQAEVEKARTVVESSAIYQRETVQGVARTLGFYQLLAGDLAFEEEFYRGIARVQPKDIQAAAQRYLQPHKATLVVMIPKDEEVPKIGAEDIQQLFDENTQKYKPKTTTKANQATLHTLSNGVRVILKANHHAPLVSLRAAMLGGLRFEEEQNNGITQLTARLLTKGTNSVDAEELAEITDAMAGSIGGFSGRNSIGLRGTFLRKNFDRGLELFMDCLLDPIFPADEVERERRLTLEDIRSSEDQLAYKAFQQFHRTLYKTHPYRLPTMGTLESVAAIQRDQIAAYYERLRTPRNLVLSVVGDIDPEETLAMLEQRLVGLEDGEFVQPQLPTEEGPTEIVHVEEHKERMQAHLVLGFMGVTMFDPDRYAIDVMNSILAGQGGRLFLELRDKLSLAYSVSSFSAELVEPGYFAVYIGTSPNKLEQAREGILRELQLICDEPVSIEEFDRTKRHLAGAHAISLQKNGSQANNFALNELYGLGFDHHDHYPEKIRSVTREDIQRVAKRLLQLDRYVLSIVRPAEEQGE